MTEWNDGRLDDLSKKVDRIETKTDAGFADVNCKMEDGFARLDKKMEDGFARVDAKFDEFFSRIDAKFDLVNDRFDNLYRMLLKAAWGFAIGMLGFGAALIGLLATKV